MSRYALLVLFLVPSISLARPILPDLTVEPSYLLDNSLGIEGGRSILRVSTGTPNIGEGKLRLEGVFPANADGTQDVLQRIYDTNGNYYDRLAGKFSYHTGHNHIHVDNWCVFRVREILPGDGVGPILAEGAKISFCIFDLRVHDATLPNFDPDGEFRSCGGFVQGLSVGWMDIYSKSLEGQTVDVTDVPPGEYWLEAVVDPDDSFIESDETNNSAMVKVQITDLSPQPTDPDLYEPNDSAAEVANREMTLGHTPNLGPCAPFKQIEGLTIDSPTDEDFFRFYVNSSAPQSAFVRISFLHAQGDLDLRVVDEQGNQVGASAGVSDSEFVSMDGWAPGWYFAQVYGFSGAENAYDLYIDPPQNGAPTVDVILPPAGITTLEQGIDHPTVSWDHSDPENDPTWVSVYVNDRPFLDGNETLVPTTRNLDAKNQFVTVNSAYLPLGNHWFYVAISDGGTVVGDWSQGYVVLEPNSLSPGQARYTFEPGWTAFSLKAHPKAPLSASAWVQRAADTGFDIGLLVRFFEGDWQVYLPGLPMNNFIMQPGEGYFLYTDQSRIFDFLGDPLDPQMTTSLHEGWNFAGFPHLAEDDNSQDLCDTLEAAGVRPVALATWQGGAWLMCLCDRIYRPFAVPPTGGYMVYTEASGDVGN